MEVSSMGKVYTYEYKVSTIRNYLESGMTQQAYIASIGISACTFYSWLKKYRESLKADSNALIDITGPIKAVSSEFSNENVEKSFKLRIKNATFEFDISQLKFVLEAMKND